jgi:hypothetical protein
MIELRHAGSNKSNKEETWNSRVFTGSLAKQCTSVAAHGWLSFVRIQAHLLGIQFGN